MHTKPSRAQVRWWRKLAQQASVGGAARALKLTPARRREIARAAARKRWEYYRRIESIPVFAPPEPPVVALTRKGVKRGT